MSEIESMKNDILIYFDILTSVKTVAEVETLSTEIDKLLESVFETKKKSFDHALSEISAKSEKQLEEIFKKSNLDVSNQEGVKNCLEKLKELLKKFKVIKLTIAFEPSYKTIEKISGWVFEKLGPGFVLDIDTDFSIEGGAILVFSGQYRDLTLKKSIEEIFEEKRSIFANLL